MARCGIFKNQPYFEGAKTSTMQALSAWVIDSDKIISFQTSTCLLSCEWQEFRQRMR